MKNKIPVSALKQFYFAHIHSHLMFCSFIFLRCCKSDITQLQRLQSKTLKLLFNLLLRFSTTKLFEQYAPDVLPLLWLHLIEPQAVKNFCPSLRHLNLKSPLLIMLFKDGNLSFIIFFSALFVHQFDAIYLFKCPILIETQIIMNQP